MRKKVRQLREKAVNALVLSIDHFNRPWDQGRSEAVLILIHHSFEMLLKAAILERGGSIVSSHDKQTIGFDACVQKARSNGALKFLTRNQEVTLHAIKGLRNAAHHYIIDISEHQLYFYAQAGVTLFRDVHDNVFSKKLILELPERVLPISTTAPADLLTLFDTEIEEIGKLLAPGTRRRMDALTRVRSLVILEHVVGGDLDPPSDGELSEVCKQIAMGKPCHTIFPGVASINMTAETDGPTLCLRLTKNEGVPVRLLKEGENPDAAVAVRRVDELGFYSLGAAELANKVGLTGPKARALVDHLDLRRSRDYFKEIKIGSSKFARYSRKAMNRMKSFLAKESIDDVWIAYQAMRRKSR